MSARRRADVVLVVGLEVVEPDDGLGVADVDGQEHHGRCSLDGAVSPGMMSRPMSSTGAEWVSAPIDTRSAPVVA